MIRIISNKFIKGVQIIEQQINKCQFWGQNERFNFASKKKIQTVGFSRDSIENIKNLSYKSKNPITFKNGKFLIYQAKSSIFPFIIDYFLYFAAIGYLSYLIYSQKTYQTYPIMKHVYAGGLMIVGALLTRKIAKNQHVVKEIYLMEGGKASQIIFRNQLKRKMFRQILDKTYYNSIFTTPQQRPNELKSFNVFPSSLNELKPQQKIVNYWIKWYSNDQNYLLIPTTYNYMHNELLEQVMNGKVIIT